MPAGKPAPRVLCIAGPSASGKTALSLALAERLPAEVVCMDSMQVYRGMDIGTAKPTRRERERVPHHMLDVADPREAYSVARYREEALACIGDIGGRGRLPLLTGGTGLYLEALSRPLALGAAPGDEGLRRQYKNFLADRGPRALHALLAGRDPDSAARLHPNDTRRVIRALEVLELTGKPLSAWRDAPGEGPLFLRVFALRLPREELYRRARDRVYAMVKAGLAEEVRGLLAMGVPPEARSMQGLGYKEMLPCLAGAVSLEEAIETTVLRTRRFIKRQLTWFRADPRVTWLEADGAPLKALADRVIETLGEEGWI